MSTISYPGTTLSAFIRTGRASRVGRQVPLKCIPTSSGQVPATAADERQAFLSPLFLIFPEAPAGCLGGPLRLQCGSCCLRVLPQPSPRGCPPAPPSHVTLTLGGPYRRNSFQQLKPLIPYPLEILAFGFWQEGLFAHQVSMNKDFFLPFFFS